MPAWFAKISKRFATPTNSILFMGGLIAVLALTGSFVWLAVISTLARMIVYSISLASLPKMERGRPLVWLMIVAGLSVCVYAALQTPWTSWRTLIILIAAGSVLYLLAPARGDRAK